MKRTKSVLLILGVVFLVSAALLFISMLAGFTDMPTNVIAGESTVHSVARVAIVGCLLAAIDLPPCGYRQFFVSVCISN